MISSIERYGSSFIGQGCLDDDRAVWPLGAGRDIEGVQAVDGLAIFGGLRGHVDCFRIWIDRGGTGNAQLRGNLAAVGHFRGCTKGCPVSGVDQGSFPKSSTLIGIEGVNTVVLRGDE